MTDPLAPQPMTPEQVADLVERVRKIQHHTKLCKLAKARAASQETYRLWRYGR